MSQIKVDVNLVKDTIVSNHSELLSEQASARQESTNGFGLILGMLQQLQSNKPPKKAVRGNNNKS